MTPDPAAFHREVLLTFQRALWDLVTPNLRAVTVRIEYPTIFARFIYEGVDEDERMIASEAEAYVVADFVPPVDVSFDAVAGPRELLPGEHWIFRRREAS